MAGAGCSGSSPPSGVSSIQLTSWPPSQVWTVGNSTVSPGVSGVATDRPNSWNWRWGRGARAPAGPDHHARVGLLDRGVPAGARLGDALGDPLGHLHLQPGRVRLRVVT